MTKEKKKEVVDSIRVALYLDGLRRKSTSLEEVACIDWLMNHFNLKPGRKEDATT